MGKALLCHFVCPLQISFFFNKSEKLLCSTLSLLEVSIPEECMQSQRQSGAKREPADGRRRLQLPPEEAPPSLQPEQVGLRASLGGRNVTEALFISLGGKKGIKNRTTRYT